VSCILELLQLIQIKLEKKRAQPEHQEIRLEVNPVFIILVNQGPKSRHYFVRSVWFYQFFVVSKKADDHFVSGMNKTSDQCCGSGAFLTPGSGMEKKFRIRDTRINIPDHFSFSERLETVLGLKILKLNDSDPGSGSFLNLDPRWKNSVPGSGINIGDPQHCWRLIYLRLFFSHLMSAGIVRLIARYPLPFTTGSAYLLLILFWNSFSIWILSLVMFRPT
jgi:hypothetical protein